MADLSSRASDLLPLFGSGANATAAASVIRGRLDTIATKLSDVTYAVDNTYLMFSAYMVFIMQLGFAMFCAGSVRAKNAKNVVLTSVIDAAAGSISYYLFGYALAFGGPSNGFVGTRLFGLKDFPTPAADYSFFIYQWSFAITPAGLPLVVLCSRQTQIVEDFTRA